MTDNQGVTTTPRHRARLARPVLASNLASGALLLMVPAAFGAWPLSLIGGGYVVAGSLFLAAAYGRESLSVKQEALVWIAPWLVAAVLWSLILSSIDPSGSFSAHLLALGTGVLVATPCYVGWQVAALAIRQFLSWRHGVSAKNSALIPDETAPVQ